MKVTSQGNVYLIHTDLMRTHEDIPAGVYYVRREQSKGFYLHRRPMPELNESKIYGELPKKCDKALDTFARFERNLGVILSGDKGIGKSLFAKVLSQAAIGEGYPVLIIDRPYDELGDFLDGIEQECIVIFDEFDKTFAVSGQNEMLSVFDGMSVGKKLFVITCNELSRVSEFLVNRPGRFHYHFRFGYPGTKEVKEYLEDKVPACYHTQILDAVVFSKKAKLNYDCLRAIAFELSLGIPFEEAVRDLNVPNSSGGHYDVCLSYTNGTTLTNDSVKMDLITKDKKVRASLYDNFSNHVANVSFMSGDVVWDEERDTLNVPADKLHIELKDGTVSGGKRWNSFFDCDDTDEKCDIEHYRGLIAEGLTISCDESEDFGDW